MSESVMDSVEEKVAQPLEEKAPANPGERSLIKGLLAGLVGGIVATAAKSLAEKIYPSPVDGEPEPPEVLAEKAAGHDLDEPDRAIETETIHWAFNAIAGAAYGAIAEFYPAATAKEGATFGMTLAALKHESALPAMGLSAPSQCQTDREKASEMVTHVVFGLVTETVRKFVRNRL